jgi:glycosyltransferase involved in cell wall biosynthesis
MKDVAIVLGTFNRRPLLEKAIASIRQAVGALSYEIVVVDGGSSDGSREWLAAQEDVVLLGQRGPLTGAVIAFNLGFSYAVDSGAPFICHLNDDAEFMENERGGTIELAVRTLRESPMVGEIAFAFDLFKGRDFDVIHGKVYANFGVVRREAGMAVARAQGDPSGRAWWNPIYKVYGADCEFACWMWRLGWTIVPDNSLKVHDANPQDALRANHDVINPGRTDSKLFWERWKEPTSVEPMTKLDDVNWEGAKLHLGCGTHRMQYWLNVDGLAGPAVDVVMDFVADLHRVPSRTVERIYWSHGPEHVHPDQLGAVLGQLRRILQPGGRLIVATIDFKGIYENRFVKPKNGAAWNSALYGETNSTDHPYLSHKQAFTAKTLANELESAGFANVKPWTLDQYPEIKSIRDYALTCELVTCFVEGQA